MRIINVKNYDADNNQIITDTEIQAAIAAGLIDNNRPESDQYRYRYPLIVYFPNGTYTVTKTLESRINTNESDFSYGWRSGMVLIGESRENTIIQLVNDANGFNNTLAPKAIIRTGSEATGSQNQNKSSDGLGNEAFRHYICNFTIKTGNGNPGAVGIDFLASNRGAIENVTIIDQSSGAAAGILMKRDSPGPAIIKHVKITGFKHGLEVLQKKYSMTIEDLELINQTQAGIVNHDNVLNIRKLTSTNQVPVIKSTGGDGHIVLLDSEFNNGAPDNAAVINKGVLFARNVKSNGYKVLISNQAGHGKSAVGDYVQEFVSHPLRSLFPSPAQSLNLAIEDTPEFREATASEWISVTQGTTPAIPNDSLDDHAGITAAINSGKSVVYFPHGKYIVSKPILIPSGSPVHKIIGMSANIVHSTANTDAIVLEFKGNNTIMEHLRFAGEIKHTSGGTLTLRHAEHAGYESTAGGKLFLEDVMGFPYHINSGQKVWARQLNTECVTGCTDTSSYFIRNNGGTLWLMGLKTEGSKTIVETTNVGKTEVMGALLSAEIPNINNFLFKNNESSISLSYTTNTDIATDLYKNQIVETRITQKQDVIPSHRRSTPLYVGYEYMGATSLRNPENPTSTINGLDYNCYDYSGTNLSDSNFNGLPSAKDGMVTHFDRSIKHKANDFGIKYEGYIEVPVDGTYTFYTNSSDGSKLYIGNTLVVDNNGTHNLTLKSGQIGLKAGKHVIKVVYFDNVSNDGQTNRALEVSYAGPNIAKTIIPASVLYRIGSDSYSINAAGSSVANSSFTADNSTLYQANVSETTSSSNTIVTTNVYNPAPPVVYQSARQVKSGSTSFYYEFLAVTGKNYRVRLHFAETEYSDAGQRKFKVTINGNIKLDNFDIYATAGAANQALVKEFIIPADEYSQVKIVFSNIVGKARVNGIEVLPQPLPIDLFNGYYKLTNRASGKAIIVGKRTVTGVPLNSDTLDGAGLYAFTFNNNDNHIWKIEATSDIGVYKLTAKHSKKAMDVVGDNNRTLGAPLQQWPYTGLDDQKWKIESVEDGYYKLIAEHSGKVIQEGNSFVYDGNTLVPIQQSTYAEPINNINKKQWKIEPITAGSGARIGIQEEHNNKSEREVIAYPNPAAQEVHLTIPGDQPQEVVVYLTDFQGRSIRKVVKTVQPGEVLSFTVADLRNGLYFLRVQQAGRSTVKKIMIAR